MKKLFGNKTKAGKGSSRDFAEDGLKAQMPTPLYQKLATHGNHIIQAPIGSGQPAPPPPRSAADDERWEVVPTPLPSAAAVDPNAAPHLPNPHSPPLQPPPSSMILPPSSQGQQPIATVTPPSRASSFGSLQAQAQAQAPLPSAQHHPAVGVLPPRSASPMSTASGTTNKLIKHRDRDKERAERERAERERDAYNQPQAGGGGKKKKNQPTAPVALGILRALDPPRAESNAISRSLSEERDRRTVSESGHGPGYGSNYTNSVVGDPRAGVYHRELSSYSYRDKDQPAPPGPPPVVIVEKEKKEKRGFWVRDKDKDKDKDKERAIALEREREKDRGGEIQSRDPTQRERYDHSHSERGREPRREDDSAAELTRMIGYLTATASEDWALVLDVCDRASANETSAKDAVRALRREFKYGEPAAQLSAARLWAIMLRNSSDVFITQSTTRKFLDTLEDLLSSSRTSPVVRERLLEVVAAAAYASGNKKGGDRDGFKGLWKRVKPFDKPDEGVPFDTDDAMFNPPTSASGRLSSAYDIPTVAYQEPTPPAIDSAPLTPAGLNPIKERSKRRSPTRRDRIIPLEEDIRRLFQECKIGQGNASLLSQALVSARPEDLKRQDIIREFYTKCRASQELIYAQIPWASAGAERAMANKEKEREQREKEKISKNHHTRNRTLSNDINRATANAKDRSNSPPDAEEGTMEENLLAALLAANGELVEVLRQYEDLERVAMERKAEDRSRKEVRMDPRQRDRVTAESGGRDSWGGGVASTTSRTPSPPSRSHSPQLSYQSHQQNHHQANNNAYQQRHQYPYQQQQQQAQPPGAGGPPLAQPRPKHPGLPESYSYPSDINLLGSNNTSNNSNNNNPNPNLAPPPAAPHGPRSPAQAPSTHSRASSPATPSLGSHGHAGVAAAGGGGGGAHAGYGMVNGHGNGHGYGSQHGHGYSSRYADEGRYDEDGEGNNSDEGYGEYEVVPVKPSAKALGKRKVVEPEVSAGPQFDPDDMYAPLQDAQFYDSAHGQGQHDPDTYSDDDNYSDSHHRPGWPHHQPTHFVYDAVAERTKQWQLQLQYQEEQEKAEQQQQQEAVGAVTANGAH